MGGRRRLGLVALATMVSVVAVAASCSDFDATPLPAEDGGMDSTIIGADAADAGSDDDAASDADAAPPIDAGPCAKCRSGYCEEDGGCDPLVFITNAAYHADLEADGGAVGLARADEICAQQANAPLGAFRAWLSAPNSTAPPRVTEKPGGASRPVRRADGVQVAASYNAILDKEKLEQPIELTFTGAMVSPAIHVWTGTRADGSLAVPSLHCEQWTTRRIPGSPMGLTGDPHVTTKRWTEDEESFCSSGGYLYCFEVVP